MMVLLKRSESILNRPSATQLELDSFPLAQMARCRGQLPAILSMAATTINKGATNNKGEQPRAQPFSGPIGT